MKQHYFSMASFRELVMLASAKLNIPTSSAQQIEHTWELAGEGQAGEDAASTICILNVCSWPDKFVKFPAADVWRNW